VPETPAPIELNANDFTRIWNLAILIYDGDNDEADLRDYFLQAMQIYLEFTNDLKVGGTTFDDGTFVWTSEREAGDVEVVRFRAAPKPEEKPKKKKKKK
jgi:hypothetical protein